MLASEFEETFALFVPCFMREKSLGFVDCYVFVCFCDDPGGVKFWKWAFFFVLRGIEDSDDVTGFNFPAGDPDFFVVDLNLACVEHGFDGGAGPSGLGGLDGFVDAFAMGGGGDGDFEGAGFGHAGSFWILLSTMKTSSLAKSRRVMCQGLLATRLLNWVA